MKNLDERVKTAESRRDTLIILMEKVGVLSREWEGFYSEFNELTFKVSKWEREIGYLKAGLGRLGNTISQVTIIYPH